MGPEGEEEGLSDEHIEVKRDEIEGLSENEEEDHQYLEGFEVDESPAEGDNSRVSVPETV